MLTPSYIVGLVDGQGNFTVYIRNLDGKKDVKRKAKVEPRFHIKVLEHDKDVLLHIKDFFQCGNVYFQKDNRKNHHHAYRYEVTSREDLEKIIIPFFINHPLQFSSQKNNFALFCEIIRRIKRKEHASEHGLRVLHSIKKHMQ